MLTGTVCEAAPSVGMAVGGSDGGSTALGFVLRVDDVWCVVNRTKGWAWWGL